jgi:hypothetical protein
MGKSKKRIFNKNSSEKGIIYRRSEIISKVISDIKDRCIRDDTKNFITLFGITAEELLENGLSLEDVSILQNFLNK